jgi:deoxyribodipyrimidine photo-lyase
MASSPGRQPALIWFRDDLRLADNPALSAACADDRPVALLYIVEDDRDGIRPLGEAARWWLHHSLERLAASIEKHGNRLILRRGRAKKIVPEIATSVGATTVFWNRRYGAAAEVDDKIERALKRKGIRAETHKANLLFEPDEISNRAGDPFQVYSAFWRTALSQGDPRPPLGAPRKIRSLGKKIKTETLKSLSLLPHAPDWSGGIGAAWTPGETSGTARLDAFVEDGRRNYASRRDKPGIDGTSMLSPHLRFGEVSPFQIWHQVSGRKDPITKFLSEIGWREFAFHLLGQYPAMAEQNLKSAFDNFPWDDPFSDVMWAWRRGRTGYPIVDAGMRQLWQIGWMHNRVRMIVASFLTKHLLVEWRLGEEWFWDTLVDADPANNPFNWQWVAGSGADAQPYFRIFNPVLQGEKFDPRGHYVRKYVPEIAKLPDRFLHKPWKAPPSALREAGIKLGETYPEPIVDHADARARALDAFAEMQRLSATAPR